MTHYFINLVATLNIFRFIIFIKFDKLFNSKLKFLSKYNSSTLSKKVDYVSIITI